MLYSSTRGQDNNLDFVQVMLNGLAKDGGLYVPNKIPKINKKRLESLRDLPYHQIAFEVTKDFVISDDISIDDYQLILNKTYSRKFGKEIISLDKLNENEFILNLFHGPTFAFKDYALQLLGNLYDFILEKKKIKLTIIGATSGDTGSAAVYGCSKSKRTHIFILFPKDRVSNIQRRQMTTFNKPNVTNIAVEGNFDDCQKLVKDFFKLNQEKKKYNLAAINSINWVRILGQIVYYFWSYYQVEKKFVPLNFVVPTGNFGNVYAGFVSKCMGLPIKKLVVCSNKNDILTRFFSTGSMIKRRVLKSLSPSMDIQVSSNFERLIFYYLKNGNKTSELFNEMEEKGKFSISKKLLSSILKEFLGGKLSDDMTTQTIKKIYQKYDIITDPHTAVGYSVGKKLLENHDKRIYLSTAHYSKFFDTVNDNIDKNIFYPDKLKNILKKKEKYICIKNDLADLENVIKKKNFN